MPRPIRVDVAGYAYHIINRGNARFKVFEKKEDYLLFESILEEGVERYEIELLAYCLMPNHWHLVIMPEKDGELRRFMGWLTNTHTRRWHVLKKSIGQGHLYQGRYKSFLCQDNRYFISLIRYVESNAFRAGLVENPEDWEWSSCWRRKYGTNNQKALLGAWSIDMPDNYSDFLKVRKEEEIESIRKSVIKGCPYGESDWMKKIVTKFGLEQTLRKVGRPLLKFGNGG